MSSTDSPGDEMPPGTEFQESRHGIGFRDGQIPRSDSQRRRRALKEEMKSLEAELSSLEKERAGLERTVEYKERQRQQLIDNYEQVLEARHQRQREESERKGSGASQQSAPSYPGTLRRLLRIPILAPSGVIKRAIRRLREAVDRISERLRK